MTDERGKFQAFSEFNSLRRNFFRRKVEGVGEDEKGDYNIFKKRFRFRFFFFCFFVFIFSDPKK